MDISLLHHFIQQETNTPMLYEDKKLMVLSKSYYKPVTDGCSSFINFVIIGIYDVYKNIPPIELTVFFNEGGYISSGEKWKGNEVVILHPEETEEILIPFFMALDIKEPFCK